jgi:hypothetical protein
MLTLRKKSLRVINDLLAFINSAYYGATDAKDPSMHGEYKNSAFRHWKAKYKYERHARLDRS